jgi:CMP-N-acetylneuraminic acid synthetase
MNNKVVALLPMKANSERVVGKNFRKLGDKALFKWILDSLLDVSEVDLVVINTDARDILKKHGVLENDRIMIRDRKQELCGDLISMNLILEDDINAVKADQYIMTHTTNPLLSASTIKRALSLLNNSSVNDSLFSVNKLQTRFYRKDMSPVNHDPQNLIRTQDLEPWYEENSCLYIFNKNSFASTKNRIGKSPIMFETPPLESIDIDEQTDWDLAEALAATQNFKG